MTLKIATPNNTLVCISNLPLNSATVDVKTNSSLNHKVTITRKAGPTIEVSGTGERTALLRSTSLDGSGLDELTFVVETEKDGGWVRAQLRTGGPYEIGALNMFIVVAEAGDDSDFNDVVITLSWRLLR